MGHFGQPYPTHQFWHIASGTFEQTLTKGSWAGLVKLIAYNAAKLVIEEYLMTKFLKINYQLEDKKNVKSYDKQEYTRWLDI